VRCGEISGRGAPKKLSSSAWYRVPADWTVCDAEMIATLAKLVEGRNSRGFWKCSNMLKRQGKLNHPGFIGGIYG